MKIFLKILDKLKKSESSEQECQYDKGWNDAIAKVEELFSSYNVSDMWIPADVKLPPEPEGENDIEDLPEYIVTLKYATLPTSLVYIGNEKWADTSGRETGCTVLAWMPMPKVYKESKK